MSGFTRSTSVANTYRPEIDGLRAIAIVPVVLHHSQVDGFSGGFVGVDVFFVISGFLITSILLREFSEGTYSIASFYERRARRILPALLAVLCFTLMASPLFLLPSEFKTIPSQVLGTLFFVGNVVLWQQSGYFSEISESKPLLHTWSLGVEEQFYLIAPVALWLFIRHGGERTIKWSIAALLLLSFAICVYLTPLKPSASFYLLPTRAWELLVGALIACNGSRSPEKIPQSLREGLPIFGLFLLLASITFYSEDTKFPGYSAAVPVLGAALVIAFGQGTFAGKLLSLKPFVFLGLISYSLYLWHWPLIVFLRNIPIIQSSLGKTSLIIFMTFIAWLSWRFIETPNRDTKSLSTRKFVWLTVPLSSFVVLAAFFFQMLNGWDGRFNDETLAYDQSRSDFSLNRERCHIGGGNPSPTTLCVIGTNINHVAVWSDSHGVELSQAIAERGISVKQITYSGCAPSTGNPLVPSRPDRPHCDLHNKSTLNYLVSTKQIDTVVLTAYFNSQPLALAQQISALANVLTTAGKRVIVIGPFHNIRSGRVDIPTWLARGNSSLVPYEGVSSAMFKDQFQKDVNLIMPEEIFCSGGMCHLSLDNRSLFFDSNHPSMYAQHIVADRVRMILQNPSRPNEFQ